MSKLIIKRWLISFKFWKIFQCRAHICQGVWDLLIVDLQCEAFKDTCYVTQINIPTKTQSGWVFAETFTQCWDPQAFFPLLKIYDSIMRQDPMYSQEVKVVYTWRWIWESLSASQQACKHRRYRRWCKRQRINVVLAFAPPLFQKTART